MNYVTTRDGAGIFDKDRVVRAGSRCSDREARSDSQRRHCAYSAYAG